jgi:hypothetical protein
MQPNKVPKSFRLDMRLTERMFRELRRITMNKKALNPPTISEIVTRGIVLAIREREKRDKKRRGSFDRNQQR